MNKYMQPWHNAEVLAFQYMSLVHYMNVKHKFTIANSILMKSKIKYEYVLISYKQLQIIIFTYNIVSFKDIKQFIKT